MEILYTVYSIEYILLIMYCSAVSVECPSLNSLWNISHNLFSAINLFNYMAKIRSRILLRNGSCEMGR